MINQTKDEGRTLPTFICRPSASVPSAMRGRAGLVARTGEPTARAVSAALGGNQPPDLAQAKGRHAPIDSFILPWRNAIGFVPNPDIATAHAHPFVEGYPCWPMRVV